MREQPPIDGHSQEGDGPRLVASDLPLERGESCLVFCSIQVTDADTASTDDIGEPKPPFRKPPIFLIGERFADEAGVEEEFPKAIGGARKMVSQRG
jgi:hypothetical protein